MILNGFLFAVGVVVFILAIGFILNAIEKYQCSSKVNKDMIASDIRVIFITAVAILICYLFVG